MQIGLRFWFTGLVYGLYQTRKPNQRHDHDMSDGHGAGLVYGFGASRKPNPQICLLMCLRLKCKKICLLVS